MSIQLAGESSHVKRTKLVWGPREENLARVMTELWEGGGLEGH